MSAQLSLCIFVPDQQLAQSLVNLLNSDRYLIHQADGPEDFFDFVAANTEQIDSLIVLQESAALSLLNQLYEQGILLPVIILQQQQAPLSKESTVGLEAKTYCYHSAEVRLSALNLDQIVVSINQAIGKFLHLGPSCPITKPPTISHRIERAESQPSSLILQQWRLSEKLKERLGYLGVYYKRNPQAFYRNLSPEAKETFLQELKAEYREIILIYFSQDGQVNQEIDQFANRAFFADLSASQILEIHMDLIDEFSQQLKLEGRSDDILLDYRLTLIDILAHLGEMYRRSIPQENLPLNVL